MSDTKICTRCSEEKPNTFEYFYKSTHGNTTNPCKVCIKKKVPYIKPTYNERACTKCGVIKPCIKEFFYIRKNGNLVFPCKACQTNSIQDKTIPLVKKCNICEIEKPNTSEFFPRTGKLPPLAHLKHTCKVCKSAIQKDKRDGESKQERKIRLNRKVRSSMANKGTFRKGSYRAIDKKKGRNNDLTTDFVNESLSKPCIYCGFQSTGLDRIDNNEGHTMSNCVPCCKECNTARNDNFTHEEMKLIGLTIRKVKIKRQIENGNT